MGIAQGDGTHIRIADKLVQVQLSRQHHQHIIKMDKPTFSKRVSGGTRIYYIDIHSDSKGSPYIVISEVPTDKAKGPQKRQRIFLHPEHLDEFQEALDAAIDQIKNDIER